MTALWDGTAARPPPSAFATTAATSRTPGAQQGPGPSTTGPATAPLPKGPPAIGAADRARALRYMKKGDEELGEGRVAPARLLYERAADMGIPQAAMAMAATYDADELNKLGLVGIPPDAALAKRWYERARALGAKGADRRLQRLGAN
jgi:hypothetical protein